VTVEGLARNGDVHPLQRRFVEAGAVQCGFCTPGMLMTAADLLRRKPNASEEDVREFMHGNYCRCTGYVKIVEACLRARADLAQGS
jgi:carbon-monoxide dehydrogenase small subunit